MRGPAFWSHPVASMAAAWDAVSDGAEVTDRVLEVLGGYLDRPAA